MDSTFKTERNKFSTFANALSANKKTPKENEGEENDENKGQENKRTASVTFDEEEVPEEADEEGEGEGEGEGTDDKKEDGDDEGIEDCFPPWCYDR